MIKRIFILAVMFIMIFQSSAYAAGTGGEVIFRDSLYGAAIGALLGTAVYLADQRDFGTKLGVGVVLGTLGGLIYGITETRSFVEIEKDSIRVSVPTPVIQKNENDVLFSASILKTTF